MIHPWQANLRRLRNEWQEETGDALQPVSAIEDYFYEALADQGRSKSLENGLFLSTVHSVKGLEFDHVFILGDSWKELSAAEMEEERRLYYVGMSRARATLHLFSFNGRKNPHADLLGGDYVTVRKISSSARQTSVRKYYELWGMEDLFLDFAGTKAVSHPVRRALQELKTGDLLHAKIHNDHVELVSTSGIAVARLSKAAQSRWIGRLQEILEIRIVAIVRRYKEDVTAREFSSRCQGEVWEVPIVELSLKR